VIVGGNVLLRDGRPVHVDMDALAGEVAAAAASAEAAADPGRPAVLRRLRPSMLQHPPAV
jgi:hypothetical protein